LEEMKKRKTRLRAYYGERIAGYRREAPIAVAPKRQARAKPKET
jgi:hypothetical protein